MEERMQMEQEVTLEQMLEARERRVQRAADAAGSV